LPRRRSRRSREADGMKVQVVHMLLAEERPRVTSLLAKR
jgi:hypothetical protein